MPVAKSFSLDELMKVLDEFVAANNKEITYEYILIRDINDQTEHVKELAYLLKHRLAHVNLIPYNPIQGADYQTPSKESVSSFSKALTALGVHNTIHVAMGADVNAACGQLAVRSNNT
jgi:23S rRNA (adenine2503-C2)-methyltransferase